jgi:hypothetical protein
MARPWKYRRRQSEHAPLGGVVLLRLGTTATSGMTSSAVMTGGVRCAEAEKTIGLMQKTGLLLRGAGARTIVAVEENRRRMVMATEHTVAEVIAAANQNLNLGAAAIVDTSANVAANLDSLQTLASEGKIGSVSFTDSTSPTLAISYSQYQSDQTIISLFQGQFGLIVDGLTIAQALALTVLPSYVAISISDTAANISSNLDALQTLSGSVNISSIIVPEGPWGGPAPIFTLTPAQISKDAQAISKLQSPSNTEFDSSAIITNSGTVSIAVAINAERLNAYIGDMTVADTSANINSAISTIINFPHAQATSFQQFYFGFDSYSFGSITSSDQDPTFNVPYSDYSIVYSQLLSAVTQSYTANITGVSIANALATTGQSHPTNETISISVADTRADIESNIDLLEALANSNKLSSITVTDKPLSAMMFTPAEEAADAAAIAKILYSSAPVNSDFTDGKTSDVLLQSGGTVVDWIMSNGLYSTGNVLTAGATGYTTVGTGDFIGNGTADVLLQNGGTVVDWIMSNGQYQSGNILTTGATEYNVVGTGDFTGNGVSDVLLQNGGTVVDWIMSNGQYQSGNVLTSGATGYTVVGTGDFTGNGTDDVLLQNGGTVVDWLMQNGQYQSGNVLTTGATGYTVVGTGDFTGTGTDDVLLQNGGTVVDWIMTNGQYQSGNVITTTATGFTVVGTGDYNGDGTSDVLLQNGGTVVDWIMKNGQYQSGNVITTTATGFTVSPG